MRARDVSVRIERVLRIPHGAKLLIDAPPGEDVVVWVRADQDDKQIAAFVNQALAKSQCPHMGIVTHEQRTAS